MTGPRNHQPLAPPRAACVEERNNKQVAKRIDNMKRLVDELGLRLMTPADMGQFLGFSPSGVRKYLADLREARILEAHGTDFVSGRMNYGVVDDPAQVAAFLAGLASARKDAPSRRMKSNVDLALSDKSRHFHLLQDDAYYAIRVSKVVVAPDPLALHRDFFKASGASLPAAVRATPVIPAAPTGFAALAVHFKRRAPDAAAIQLAKTLKATQRNERLRKAMVAECRQNAVVFGQLAGATA